MTRVIESAGDFRLAPRLRGFAFVALMGREYTPRARQFIGLAAPS
jgi:hypothetical protein